jgi:hypothetical protein
MNCSHCPDFHCILKSDYSRHILTKSHSKNKDLNDAMRSLHIKDETISSAMYSLHTRNHDLLLHQRKMKAVLKQYWKQADYAVHVFKFKQSFAEIHDYLVATDYVGHSF